MFKELEGDVAAAVVAGLHRVAVECADAIAVTVDNPLHALLVKVASKQYPSIAVVEPETDAMTVGVLACIAEILQCDLAVALRGDGSQHLDSRTGVVLPKSRQGTAALENLPSHPQTGESRLRAAPQNIGDKALPIASQFVNRAVHRRNFRVGAISKKADKPTRIIGTE